MENTDSELPETKRRHLNSVSSPMARSSPTSPDDRPVDATVLQYQNQKLVQQLDAQKHELHALESNFQELKDKHNTYNETLILVNKLWNQLVDDLILLRVQAGGNENGLRDLDRADRARGSFPSCSPEKIFLWRLSNSGPAESSGGDETVKWVEEALYARHSSTMDLMKSLEDVLDTQSAKAKSLPSPVPGKLSGEDAIIQVHKLEELMKEDAANLRKVIDVLQLKHKEYADEIQTLIQNHSTDQSEIKRITGELEESMAELEASRRKLVNLKMQMGGVHIKAPNAVNGSTSPEKSTAGTMGLRELKTSIEEAKTLAATRHSELQEAQEDTMSLSKQLHELQNDLEDEKFVVSSRPYTLLSDQLQHWKAEVERYKGLTESLQAERTHVLRREKELTIRAESAEAARSSVRISEARIGELEHHLQNCIIERNDLEIKVEEAEQDSGRKDIKTEFNVMASAISKELGMVEAQVKRCKETASEALSLREEAHSLKAQLNLKMDEHKSLTEKCAEQMAEIKFLKSLIEKLRKETQELQFFLDMHAQERFDNRDVMEIKESERRACMQAEMLKNALDEHGLELRVKAANEAEAACQQRLSAAESEITDLSAKLDVCERDVLDLRESVKVKDAEAEAYIYEIETIGQAYEDMQSQNQHLLQMVANRDDYNIKVVSESVKTKQMQSFLLHEKQEIAKQLQQVKTSQESLKLRSSHSEDQMKTYISEGSKILLENKHIALNIENTKRELVDVEKELKWLKGAFSSSEKEYDQSQQNISELEIELESERADKKRLEEELAELNNSIVEISAESGEAAVERLQNEVKECKSMLKCSVCFDRPKEVVITKCFHLFCNPCIQRNLEIRHRKCPGCGTAFGQNDVRFVNI